MRRIKQAAAGLTIAGALAVLAPFAASAHESRAIAEGKIQMVVGFSTEPAYTGERNGLDLFVYDLSAPPAASPISDDGDNDAPAGTPIEGLEDTLKAEIIFGDQKMDVPIEACWQKPGEYDGWIIPTAAGDYTWHIYGTINGTAVDEQFTSSPDGFGSVADRATIEFPKSTAMNSAAPVFGTLSDGRSSSTSIFGGAAVGLVVGAAGLTLIQRRRRANAQLTPFGAGAGD